MCASMNAGPATCDHAACGLSQSRIWSRGGRSCAVLPGCVGNAGECDRRFDHARDGRRDAPPSGHRCICLACPSPRSSSGYNHIFPCHARFSRYVRLSCHVRLPGRVCIWRFPLACLAIIPALSRPSLNGRGSPTSSPLIAPSRIASTSDRRSWSRRSGWRICSPSSVKSPAAIRALIHSSGCAVAAAALLVAAVLAFRWL